MAMDLLEAMRTFVRVIERGSFSAAAKELGATQSRGAAHPRAHVRASRNSAKARRFRRTPVSVLALITAMGSGASFRALQPHVSFYPRKRRNRRAAKTVETCQKRKGGPNSERRSKVLVSAL
jgi:hypothetical protein